MRKMLPRRFRTDIPRVPVVRLSGAIGISSPLRPGLTLASSARALERAFAFRGAPAVAIVDQFAGRLGRAVAPHLHAHPCARRGEEGEGHRLRRGCRGLRRLHDRLRGRRDHRGPEFDRRLDRRRRRLVRRLQACWRRSASSAASTPPARTRRCSTRSCPEKPDDVRRLKAIQEDIHESFISLVKDSRGGETRARREPVHRRVLDWPHRARPRPDRRPRRHPRRAARAIRREGRDAADLRRRAACSAARRPACGARARSLDRRRKFGERPRRRRGRARAFGRATGCERGAPLQLRRKSA